MTSADSGETEENPSPALAPEEEIETEGYQTLAHGFLSPRHRRFALLVAQGSSGEVIKKEVGYSDSRISILKKNPHVSAEIARLQEKIYEETIGGRLKGFANASLDVIEQVLNDRTNKVKVAEKIQVAQWVIEKIDGKATQKIEAGENMLAALMDRLDAAKTRPTVQITNNYNAAAPQENAIDVTDTVSQPQLSAPKSEEDLLDDWLKDWET